MKKILMILLTLLICLGIIIYSMYRIDNNLMEQGLEVAFSTWGKEYTPIPKKEHEIESIKELELNFSQRKDLGLKLVTSYEEIDVYTYGGDVTITLENDMVYELTEVFSEISLEDILNRADFDASAGKCQKLTYIDGGSVEYCYDNFTILKLDTLNGFNEFVIGHKGTIINEVTNKLRDENEKGFIR